jgi:hypothetical protein
MDIYCHCCDCWNCIVWGSNPNTIRSHLIRRGFKENYEIGIIMVRRTDAGNKEATEAPEGGLFFDPDSEYATDPKFESLRAAWEHPFVSLFEQKHN